MHYDEESGRVGLGCEGSLEKTQHVMLYLCVGQVTMGLGFEEWVGAFQVEGGKGKAHNVFKVEQEK